MVRVLRVGVWCLLLVGSVGGSAAPATLGLEDYLKQVRSGHQGIQGSREGSRAAEVVSREGDLILSPTLYGSAQFALDKSPRVSPVFQGNKSEQHLYTLGVSKLTSFGLQGKLYYNFTNTLISGVDPTLMPMNQFFDGKLALEFSQSLWRNGFGSETRMQLEALEAKGLADQHAENFRVKLLEAEAESAYWRLALARDAVNVAKDSLGRAEKVRDWNSRRVKSGLGDESDLLQSQAALKLRTLEWQSTIDEERVAALAFNAARGKAEPKVDETVESVANVPLEKVKMPTRLDRREDVEAAYQANRAAAAASRLAIEKNRPNFEIYGAFSTNGRADTVGGAISDSFNTNKPMAAAGVRFSLPLSFGLVGESEEARVLEAKSSELKYQRKVFEQDKEWKDFNLKFAESIKRLDLSRQIEEVQKEKYTNEKDRQGRGRSTTFLVLQFEQDLASSQFSRLRAQTDVLVLLSQMKTFGGVQ